MLLLLLIIQDKKVAIKLKRFGDKFGSSYVNVKVSSKYADYGVDYVIENYYDESKRKYAFNISTTLAGYTTSDSNLIILIWTERHNVIFFDESIKKVPFKYNLIRPKVNKLLR